MTKATFGVIVSTRGFFPASLAREGRRQVLEKLKKQGYEAVLLPESATPNGAVETLADAEKCARLFRENADGIDGVVVVLPNFGDELGVAETLSRAKLGVPVLVQACDDVMARMDMAHRRDSFCGKLSVCNNLRQRGIPFTNTRLHTCAIDSREFTEDLARFAAICRVARGLSRARLGMIGQRPDPFNTVRYSEKLLERAGIHVSAVDMSEIIAAAVAMPDGAAVNAKITEITNYGPIAKGTPRAVLVKQAKLILTVERWLNENRCDASAIQCWSSIQQNYGCASCLGMSMMGEQGKPSACEVDVMGALSMLALRLAGGGVPGYLDWNNNFDDDRDRCVCIHCSNYPKSFIGKIREIGSLDILGASLGKEKCFGAVKGAVKAGPMTFAKISTDDEHGRIRMYVGEGEFTKDIVDTAGGVAVCRVKGLQKLLDHLCRNGFEHHVAMVRGRVAGVLAEACGTYFGWDVHVHG
ncbi:MAG: fucose isomerase [Kiritimatiellia bacterium]